MSKNKSNKVEEQTIESPTGKTAVSTSVGFRKVQSSEGARWSIEVFEHQWDEAGALIKTTLTKAYTPASWSFAFETYQKVALDEVHRVSK